LLGLDELKGDVPLRPIFCYRIIEIDNDLNNPLSFAMLLDYIVI
jgi:hypothetical protein